MLLENVKNLLSHDKGNTFRVIRSALEELGYSISYQVINAQAWVPQNRQRIFIVGIRTDLFDGEFDLADLALPDNDTEPCMESVFHNSDDEYKEERFVDVKTGKPLPKYTLTPKLWNYLQEYAKKHAAKGNGFGFGLVGPRDRARTLSARYYKDGSEILVKRRGGRPRRLTPRECARLMGFDKPDSPLFKIPVSDTQAYKQFGNAVVVPVVEAIAQHMEPVIKQLILCHGKASEKVNSKRRQRPLNFEKKETRREPEVA